MKNLLIMSLLIAMRANAQDTSITNASSDAIINLPVTNAWMLFTTEQGLRDMGYQNVSMKVLIGEHVHAERKVGQNIETINATITSFDPQHMISWKWQDNSCWSVLYFNAMGNDMTQLRWLDFCSAPASIDLNLQATLHRTLFDQLIRRYAPECHVCKEEREAAGK